MIAVLKKNTTEEQMQDLILWLREQNLEVHVSRGAELTVLGLIGDTSHVDMDLIASLDMVDSCKRISEPFKKSSRKFHKQNCGSWKQRFNAPEKNYLKCSSNACSASALQSILLFSTIFASLANKGSVLPSSAKSAIAVNGILIPV